MAEVDDGEFVRLQKSQALLDELLRSPKTKRAVEKQIKTLHPDTVISEDFEEPFVEQINSLTKKLDGFLETQRTREDDTNLRNAFSQLRADGGYTDEGIEKIQNMMVERKIADPMAAAALYDKLNPPPKPQKPTSFNGLDWGIGRKTGDVDTDLLFADEDAFAAKEAEKFFDEQSKS